MANVLDSEVPWLTPQWILRALMAVDGAGSGLDADTLGGISAALFSLKKNVDVGDASDLSLASWGNVNQYVSLCVNTYGNSAALLINAYKFRNTRHLFDVSVPADLQCKYYGANYLGVQAPIMVHLDPNSNQVKIYVGTAGLNAGDEIGTWTLVLQVGASGTMVNGNVGFFATTPQAKKTVTGSRGGNAALASLLTALASYGLIVDGSTV